MIGEYAVKFAMEYLDGQFAKGEPADLVGMLNHVDYFERVLMILDEVYEVLRERPTVFVQRVDGRVVFNRIAGDREITEDDLKRNSRMYSDEFWAKYKELDKHRE